MVKTKCKECNCQDIEDFLETFENGTPYKEATIESDYVVRTFPKDTPEHWLKWHADEEDRIVTAAVETDWKFQFDNELPIDMELNKGIHIKKGRIHRIIKGSTSLIVGIKKLY
tara:strand:- start:437 stop:775 length:339 start_codon:yes stop_codon:yes gene_type:complete